MRSKTRHANLSSASKPPVLKVNLWNLWTIHFIPWRNRPIGYWIFMTTHRHTTLGRTPLDEWSSRRRDLYLTTHNIHNRQISIPSAGFEPTISTSERPQSHASRPHGHRDRQGIIIGLRITNKERNKQMCLLKVKKNPVLIMKTYVRRGGKSPLILEF